MQPVSIRRRWRRRNSPSFVRCSMCGALKSTNTSRNAKLRFPRGREQRHLRVATRNRDAPSDHSVPGKGIWPGNSESDLAGGFDCGRRKRVARELSAGGIQTSETLPVDELRASTNRVATACHPRWLRRTQSRMSDLTWSRTCARLLEAKRASRKSICQADRHVRRRTGKLFIE